MITAVCISTQKTETSSSLWAQGQPRPHKRNKENRMGGEETGISKQNDAIQTNLNFLSSSKILVTPNSPLWIVLFVLYQTSCVFQPIICFRCSRISVRVTWWGIRTSGHCSKGTADWPESAQNSRLLSLAYKVL